MTRIVFERFRGGPGVGLIPNGFGSNARASAAIRPKNLLDLGWFISKFLKIRYQCVFFDVAFVLQFVSDS